MGQAILLFKCKGDGHITTPRHPAEWAGHLRGSLYPHKNPSHVSCEDSVSPPIIIFLTQEFKTWYHLRLRALPTLLERPNPPGASGTHAPVIHRRGAVTPNTAATLVCSSAIKAVPLYFPILCCLYFPASLRHQSPRLHYKGYPLNSPSRPGGSSLGLGGRKTQTASHLTFLRAHTDHQALPSVSLHKSPLLFVTGSFF